MSRGSVFRLLIMFEIRTCRSKQKEPSEELLRGRQTSPSKWGTGESLGFRRPTWRGVSSRSTKRSSAISPSTFGLWTLTATTRPSRRVPLYTLQARVERVFLDGLGGWGKMVRVVCGGWWMNGLVRAWVGCTVGWVGGWVVVWLGLCATAVPSRSPGQWKLKQRAYR